jgi:alpha-D-xyloside xylohydrolase
MTTSRLAVPLLLTASWLAASILHAEPIPVSSAHKDADGVTLKMQPGTMKLQVFSPRVIRVRYGTGDSLPETKSFAVIGQPVRTRWKLSETKTDIRLSTDEVEASVNRATGAIGFYDKSGKELLLEPTSGGKSLTPNRVANFDTLQSQQAFELPRDEAIYGLGQHQQGLINYHGANVRLLQENREVAVPMLVSSRGYGVLWDNPAATEVSVGAGKEEQAIPSTQFFTEDNQPGGLTARYFSGENFETNISTQTDAQINFFWNTPPAGLPRTHFSVRWDGFLEAKQAGEYTLFASSDDGVRVWVDDQLLINDWSQHPVQTFFAKTNFAANSRHRLRVEYFQNLYGASVRLGWRLPSAEVLPLTWTSEAAGTIDYYFLYGPEPDQVIGDYRKLTGAAPMFGKWAWGFWQCKERYQSQAELLDIVSHYRSLHVPIDGIIQDWRYWDPYLWGSHAFDTNRYPDPAKLMSDLHATNVHLIISVWPRFDNGSSNAAELAAAGGLYSTQIQHGRFPSHWYDPFTAAGHRLYWQEMSRELFAYGIDGWWLDASEPELSGNVGEYRAYSTGAGPGAKVLNAFPLVHTDGVYKGQRAENSDKRVFILTRSAYAGQQRNSAVTWSGDINATWDVFAKQIPAGLNFSLSGIPYWNTDTGGFFSRNPTDPDYAELFARWFQFSAFCPMFRVHGTSFPKEMWRWDNATQKILIDYDRLRYHLLPYIYSVSWKVTSEDYTMMRGLVMDFRRDPKVYNIADQYLFGPGLMVCPVTKAGAKTRSVYLPSGTSWTDFWTGKSYPGGQTIDAASPVATMPLFVRAGSTVPYGPDIEYAMEKSDPIELRVYPGADGSFALYEDEGDNYNYEKGVHAIIPISWSESTHTLRIGKREGNFPGMLKERTFRVVWVSSEHGAGIPLTDKPDVVVRYNGSAVKVVRAK